MSDIRLGPSAAPRANSQHDVMHRTIEDYHDARHMGAYAECWGCTEIHLFMQDHPKVVEKL